MAVVPFWCMTVSFTVWPGLRPARTVPRTDEVGVLVPLTEVIESPVLRPALAAGVFARTCVM